MIHSATNKFCDSLHITGEYRKNIFKISIEIKTMDTQ